MNELDNLPQAEGTEEQKKTTEVRAEPSENTLQETADVSNIDMETAEKHIDKQKDGQDEIDASNAEDAEDKDNQSRHHIPLKDYDQLTMEQLIDELETLLKNEKVQTIKKHADAIKKAFASAHRDFIDEKREAFEAEGGNPVDFFYSSPFKKRFNIVYKEFRNSLRAYYQQLEENLKANLETKQQIIEELKGLINIEEDINNTYRHFKELQERWRNSGPIPREKYNDTWNNYHHHVEMFYDFLHLNRELRDLDFKHNLEEKQKMIAQAKALAEEPDLNKAFRELQLLHKVWKEDLGPVDKEQREEVWSQFKAATKVIHDRRHEYFKELDKKYEENLSVKLDIIQRIETIANEPVDNHKNWQKKIKDVEALRQSFFKAGKVPLKVNEDTWAKFKTAVRLFNKHKNAFYKSLKKEQQENLRKKLELIKIAEDNKDNEEFETTTQLMKQIQNEWKNIGHVPRRDSDKIWNRFKDACNHYFDRLHAKRNNTSEAETEALKMKENFLKSMAKVKFTNVKETDLEHLKALISDWKKIGPVPKNKRSVEQDFNKILDKMAKKVGLPKEDVELIKFENKLEHLNTAENGKKLDDELFYIQKKVEELKHEINQLENNLLFFAHVEDSNPVLQEVHKNIERQKDDLALWETKLKRIKNLY